MQNQPARQFSVAAFNATRQANPDGVPADGLRQSIQAVANWLTARGMNDPVQPGELKKIAALHRAAAQMHQRAGQDEAAKAHQVAAEKWEKGVGASISAAADTQMAKLINYQDGGIVDGFGRDQLKAANDGINAAKNATPANLRHLYKSGIRSDRYGYIWSWVLKEFPRKGAGLSNGMATSDGMTLRGIKPAARNGWYTVVVAMPDGAVRSFAKDINELPQWVKLYTGTSLNDAQLGNLKRGVAVRASQGASTMQTKTKPACGMSRKAAYMGRVAASQGVAAGGLTDSLYRAYERELFDIVHDTRSAAGELQDRLAKIQRFAAVQQQLKPEFKSLLGKAQQVAKQRALQDRQSYDQNAGASIAAAFKVGDKVSYPSPNPGDPPSRGVIKRIADGRATLVDSLNPGDHKTVPVSMLKPYQASGKELPFAAAAAPPFAKKPEAQAPAQPAPQAPVAPPAEPEPDPADAPLGMSRKAKFVRRMLAKGAGGAGAAQASIAAASDPASRGMQAAKRENNGAISQRIKRVLGNDPGAVNQAIGVYTQAGPQELLNWLKENYGQSVVDEMRRAGVGASIAAAAAGGATKDIPINKLQQMAREGRIEYSTDPKVGMHLEVRFPNGKKVWVMVRPPEGAGASISAAVGGTVAAAISSRNTSWGFYGTARMNGLPDNMLQRVFSQTATSIASKFNLKPEQVRDFLDSRDGRHLADAMVVEGKVQPPPAWLGKQLKSFFRTYDPAAFDNMEASIAAAGGAATIFEFEDGASASKFVSRANRELDAKAKLVGPIGTNRAQVPSQSGVIALKVGDRVKVKPGKNHDDMTKDATGTVKEVSTPALGIEFDHMKGKTHKWYVEDELEKK